MASILKWLLPRFSPVVSSWKTLSRQEHWLPVVNYIPTRSVVGFSKKGKRKTVKAVAKRFKRTGTGQLKYWRPGKNHCMMAKSGRASRELRKPRYANKTQLKMLNKMLSGI